MNKQEKWLEQQLENFKVAMKGAADEVFENLYCDYLPHLENDYEANVNYKVKKELSAFLEGLSEDHWCRNLTLNEYNGAAIRKKILEENKQEIINLLNQDSLKRIRDLEIQLENSYRTR